jgi:hypothetical protein
VTIQQRIEEVLLQHQRRTAPDYDNEVWCSCEDQQTGPGCQDSEGYAAHVTSLVLALFTEDRRRVNPKTKAKPCDNCGHLKGVHAEPCHIWNHGWHKECGCPEYRYTDPETSWESRWVSAWEAK